MLFFFIVPSRKCASSSYAFTFPSTSSFLLNNRIQIALHKILLSGKTKMWNLVHLERVLPHWLEQTQLVWVQWVYAFWQFIRGNPFSLLAFSFLPFYVRQKVKRKTVIVVGETKDIDTATYEELDEYLKHHQVINMQVVSREHPRDLHPYYKVKHNGYYYIVQGFSMRQLAKCSEDYGEDVIFVEGLLAVSGSLAVGKQISQTEAYEKLMYGYNLSKGLKYVVPTCFDYIDYKSKFWGILSTIPILLQARNYIKCSTVLSLLIILLDFFRGPLYSLYDSLFNRFTRFVKLNIFKEKTHLYDFFSIFSSRWGYTDTMKRFAYIAKPGEKMKINWCGKLRSLNDIEIVDYGAWHEAPKDGNVAMRILPDKPDYRAECNILIYSTPYAVALLKKPVFVP